MTFERRCLIVPEDIIALQYECRNCGAATVVPSDKGIGNAANTALSSCSYCHTESGFKIGTNEVKVFSEFHASLASLKLAMQGRNLKLRLQIICPDEKEKQPKP